jgi:phage-related tail fiber protein
MTIKLHLAYRTPNPRNKREHWTKTVKEKHAAQNALLSALRSAASAYSTLTPNGAQSKTCSMASSTLASYVATGREKSVSKSSKRGLGTSRKK